MLSAWSDPGASATEQRSIASQSFARRGNYSLSGDDEIFKENLVLEGTARNRFAV